METVADRRSPNDATVAKFLCFITTTPLPLDTVFVKILWGNRIADYWCWTFLITDSEGVVSLVVM